MSQENSKRTVLVSVIIPAYNEASVIEHTIREVQQVLDGCEIGYELIVVDDGSSDGMFATISRMGKQYGRVKGIRFSRNFGKEAALLAGLKAAKGDAVITMDADLQHPPTLIPELLEKWREGFKVVHGVKKDRQGDSIFTRWRAELYNYLLSTLGGINMRNASDFKLLDRVVVEVIVQQFPERLRFYRGLADWVGFEQAAIPFSVGLRKTGESKWSLPSLTGLATTTIVSFTSAPLRIVSILGLITLVFGTVVASEALFSWFRGKAVSGFVTIIITILIIGSFIMISLGIVGEYIAKMYEEIKGRPSYLVTSRFGFEDEASSNRNE